METMNHGPEGAASPLVSVIVPVYNVLPFLDQCVESLVTQTYKNLEIILVDDGSTDGSGERCHLWADKDARIQVLHRENAGAGQARNAGLTFAHGALIGFVDSDDWVGTEFVETLTRHLLEHDADLAITASSYVYSDDTMISHYKDIGIMELTSEKAFKCINVPGYFGVACWDKLARRELFCGLRFPSIVSGQDYAVAYALLDRADKVVYDSTPRYFYRQTDGSLSNSKSIDSSAKADATRDMVELVRVKYPEALPYAMYGHVIASLGAYNRVLRSGERGQWSEFLCRIEQLVRGERRNISAVVPLSRSRWVQLWMVAYTPWLYRFALAGYKAIHPKRAE